MFFNQQSSASLVARDVTTKSGREVRRSIVEVGELEQVIATAKAQGHDRITLDMGELTQFKNGKEGYVTRVRSWKAEAKKS